MTHRHVADPTADPFIAFTYAEDWNMPSLSFRQYCEKHLRSTIEQLEPILGAPAVEGIVLYDQLERGAAVVALLGETGATLPTHAQGEICDQHFDEDALCDRTNDHRVFARMHAGSRGMLVTLRQDQGRRIMLLDQRRAGLLLPMGRETSPEEGTAVIGLLAHELAHARDYAEGRPGRPSPAEVSAVCDPKHAEAIAAISDMALAEYIATRAECAAQISQRGACSTVLTERIDKMASAKFVLPPLDPDALTAGYDPEQRQADLSHAGYTLGTLAAYAAAAAPVMQRGGALQGDDTSQMIGRRLPKGSCLKSLLTKLGPVLEAAATSPDTTARRGLAATMENSLVSAHKAARERSRPRRREPSFDDWFDSL